MFMQFFWARKHFLFQGCFFFLVGLQSGSPRFSGLVSKFFSLFALFLLGTKFVPFNGCFLGFSLNF